MARQEITLEQLQDDGDWAQVFADENYGNVDKTMHAAPPTSSVSLATVTRADVAEIIAAVNGERDGSEWSGLFLLKDGRYLAASGSCDYTGWGCQAGNHLAVASTLEDALQYALTPKQRERLGL